MEISSLHSFFREKIQKKNSANAKGKEKKKLKEINNWGCSQELNYTPDKGTFINRSQNVCIMMTAGKTGCNSGNKQYVRQQLNGANEEIKLKKIFSFADRALIKKN